MVDRLPAEGGHIVVHSWAERRYVEQMILSLRGPDVAKRTRVHVIRYRGDEMKLHGVHGFIEIDHAWHSEVSVDLGLTIDRMVDQIRAICP
ncbi:hypothetical protein F3X89_03795 [Rhizobium rhizogenes]|uniref:hypothetical protein n=1 Tax=Rhizobium rhizogenes TaxID=359 RepID=UPI00193CB7C1|nr:hypothetical protein [Rhizobium rhizogenes]QRM36959.1 hypothetical protein F3X89_03795 [Rhizobium rhizogenes]